MSTEVGKKSVRVISGTGSAGIQQVNITGATGPNFRPWTQLTVAQFSGGPTGQFKTVQAMNTGATGSGIAIVSIPGYLGPL